MQARSNELLKALNDNDDIEPLLAQYQANKQNLDLNLYDNQSQLSPQLLQEIFNQSQSTAILKDTNRDNLIIRFNHVTQNSAPTIDEQLQALLYRQWQTDKQFEALEYYAKILREKANVVIYDENLPSSN
ncbi:hypothetical protein [Rappaport israeli]|uniref:hypothetical protein n=1 Tax=Rappaport israeli TaxID=1839807 RepID=UPI000931EAE3|nr:hypothetical protein [Rappaport israeli]